MNARFVALNKLISVVSITATGTFAPTVDWALQILDNPCDKKRAN